MKLLSIFIDAEKINSFLTDSLTNDTMPVYDINDRSSVTYPCAIHINENYAALGRYANCIALGINGNIQPLKDYSENSTNLNYYERNFLQVFFENPFFSTNYVSNQSCFALLIKKIVFDAYYVSNFTEIDRILFIPTVRFSDVIERFIRESYLLFNSDIPYEILSFENLLDYLSLDTRQPKSIFDSITSVSFFEQTFLIKSDNGINHLAGILDYGTGNFKKKIIGLILSSLGLQKVKLSQIDELRLDNAFSDIMVFFGNRAAANNFCIPVEINNCIHFINFNNNLPTEAITGEIDFFLRQITKSVTSKLPRMVIYNDIFQSNYIKQMAEQQINRISPVDITCEAIDGLKDFISPALYNLSSFYESKIKINETASLVGKDYYITIYDQKNDSKGRVKLFDKNLKIPAYYSAIVQGRFIQQDRIYFEIIEKGKENLENIFLRVIIVISNEMDFGENLTLSLRFFLGGDRKIRVEAVENFSGKKAEVNYIYNETTNFALLKQSKVVADFKILNNYMDKKKEMSVSIL